MKEAVDAPAETLERSKATIARLAAESFKGHVLKKEAEGRWRCGRPGTGAYAFHVVIAPGVVCFYGDIGEAILRMSEGSEADVIAWLRGCARDDYPDYLLGKVQTGNMKHFYPDDAIAWMESECTEDCFELLRSEVRQANEYRELSHQKWCELASDHGVDDAWGVGDGWSSAALWLAHALKTFIRLYDAPAV